jgi:CBS domain-containing protein
MGRLGILLPVHERRPSTLSTRFVMTRKPEERQSPEKLIPHRVRERFVCSREEERCTLSVHCEPREQSLELGKCGGCAHFARVETHGAELVMLCRPPGGCLTLTHVPVSAAMAHQVHCLRADIDCGAAGAYLGRYGLAEAPVVTHDGHFEGMVQRDALLAAPPDTPVAEVLPARVAPIEEHAPLAKGAARMAHERLSALAVVDAHGSLVGVLRALDVVGFWARSQGYVLDHDPSA